MGVAGSRLGRTKKERIIDEELIDVIDAINR